MKIQSFLMEIFSTILCTLIYFKGPTFAQQVSRNPDGSVTVSFAASDAFDMPGFPGVVRQGATFSIAQTINIGPKGTTIDGSNSFSSNIGGNRMSFSQSMAQNNQFGRKRFGFSSSGSNAMSNSVRNPLFRMSNANANAYANNFESRHF